jgi:hypothetical protein
LYAAGQASSFAVRGGPHSTRETKEIYGHGGLSSRSAWAIVCAALIPLAACDVDWGGASFAFVNPAPTPEPTLEPDSGAVAVAEPLPLGDLLYLVRLGGADGTAQAVPIARMADATPADLDLPASMDADYRARFDSAFYAADLELPLHAGGHRVGTLILSGDTRDGDARCLPVGAGRALLLPDTDPPEFAFAWEGKGAAGSPIAYDLSQTDNRMRTYGPVLAENLLRRGGENRPYLAQRAAMRPVPWPGDDRPAMAATYLVNDQIDGAPPENPASSLFFLARFRNGQYVPEWWEVRRYDDGDDKEAFVYFGAIAGPDGRVDFATRHDGVSVRLVASVDPGDDDRQIDWTEPPACPAVGRLRAFDPASAAAGTDG